MTFIRHYGNWLREAGRGHIAAVLSWGAYGVYMAMSLMGILEDPEYYFFGMGNQDLLLLTALLGLLLGGIEFGYLINERKQDFYYSLPVKKSTIFLTRYLHGIGTAVIPLFIVQVVCGIFEGVQEPGFLEYAGGYTGKSIACYILVFLLFYQVAALAMTVSGNIVAAVVTAGGLLFYTQVLIQEVFLNLAKEIFCNFYKIPALEEAGKVLSPSLAARSLAGDGLMGPAEMWSYEPEAKVAAAVSLWIVLCMGLICLAWKYRKPENVGKVYTFSGAERVAEILAAVLAGLLAGSILLQAGPGAGEKSAAYIAGACLAGMTAAAFVHGAAEWLVTRSGKKILRRKWQMAVQAAGVCLVILTFCWMKEGFDEYLPENRELERIAVCVNGLDMEEADFVRGKDGDESVVTEQRLREYVLEEEGLKAGMKWLGQLQKGEALPDKVTTAVVCYRLKDGGKRYRVYDVTEEMLQAFSGVYETEEYKRRAYPLAGYEDLEDEKISWWDGFTETVLGMSNEAKAELLKAYQLDVSEMKMDDLKEVRAAGTIKIESAKYGRVTDALVYPFFERTCALLKEQGAEVGKMLEDYQIDFINVQTVQEVEKGMSGGVSHHFYKEEEDVRKWAKCLIPKEYAIQPLLYPADTSVTAKVQVEDPASNSLVEAECYGSGYESGKK